VNITTKTDPTISKRKQDHIDVCKPDSLHRIESFTSSGFDCVRFIHHALPEINFHEVETKTEFLGKTICLPLFVSCMTGGVDAGYHVNRELAIAAQKMGIPLGLGSMRVLLSNPKRFDDFSMRQFAPDIPILGNIGAVQLKEEKTLKKLVLLMEKLELDALVIHLNCGQELFQENGDRNFRGLKEAIAYAVDECPFPVIVKETGFGIKPALIKDLIDMGVEYVDLAGSGGTNWILVEQGCNQAEIGNQFATWGNRTAVLLDAAGNMSGKILASGGLRSGMDISKAVAMGAVAAGMALPLFHAALQGGKEAVCDTVDGIHRVLKMVMTLTGSQTIADLKKVPLLKTLEFEHDVSLMRTYA